MENRKRRGVLHNRKQLGPFPMGRIRRVDVPTTIITDAVQRVDLRNTAYGLAGRGEYGPAVQKGVQKSLPGKYPLSAAQKDVIDHIALIQRNPVAAESAATASASSGTPWSVPQSPAPCWTTDAATASTTATSSEA